MIEKKRMLSGKPYKSFDKELLNERKYAKELLFEFNSTHPDEVKKRSEIVKRLFKSTGNDVYIKPKFECDYGYNIEIGNNFYANYNCIILDCAKVIIGKNVLFGPNVSIFTAGHPIHYELRNQQYEYAFPVTIGNNVWIGGNTVINCNVKIGDNTVIGSGSIVTKDIAANVVAHGNPCRAVRNITDEDKKYYYKDLLMI